MLQVRMCLVIIVVVLASLPVSQTSTNYTIIASKITNWVPVVGPAKMAVEGWRDCDVVKWIHGSVGFVLDFFSWGSAGGSATAASIKMIGKAKSAYRALKISGNEEITSQNETVFAEDMLSHPYDSGQSAGHDQGEVCNCTRCLPRRLIPLPSFIKTSRRNLTAINAVPTGLLIEEH